MQHPNGEPCSTGFSNDQGTGRLALQIAVALIVLFPVLALADEPSPQPSSPASQTEVPAALLARLRAQYIPEEAKTSDVSESDKIRRYEAILREGGLAERQYARAANLHEVRELMMAAAKGLATLEGTAEARQLVFEIARRLVNSSAPPESRVVAEMLLMRERIDDLAEWPAEAADEVAMFAARYRGTPGESTALMSAAHLCRIADVDPARHAYLRQLSEKYYSVPGVSAFLESEGVNPYLGRLMTARLVRLDGSTLELPRDTLGKFTVVHFWSMEKAGEVNCSAHGTFDFQPFYQSLRDVGVTFVGVNLNTDRARVAQCVGEQREGIDWIQTTSGLGPKDPTFLRYQAPALPAYWLVGPDGCAISNNFGRGEQQPWPRYSNGVRRVAAQLGQMAVRMPYYRSGEFLLDLPGPPPARPPGPDDVPAERLNELHRKVICPPALGLDREKKAAVLREAMELGRSIEQKYPRAKNLPEAWKVMLVATQWLATEKGDKASATQAQEIAARILESKTEGPPRLLADYIRASGELASGDTPREELSRRIDAIVKRYSRSEWDWAAAVAGAVLAMECGDENTRATLVAGLRGHADRCPKVRGFLRDLCNVNIDARTTPAQPSPLPGGTVPRAVRGELPKLGGGTLRLEDLKGKLVMIHFWSTACPAIHQPTPVGRMPVGASPDPNLDLVIVGVNLDRSREEVEKYLKERGNCPGWIQVFSGLGQDDPLARELDIYGVPRTVLLDRDGTIYRWGHPGQMGTVNYRMLAPRTTAQSTLAAVAGKAGSAAPLPKQILLDLGGKVAMKLALIPAGEFRMGSLPTDKGHFDDEEPQRLRTLKKPFYMGVHHVTRGQFAAFVQATNYKTEAEQAGWALLAKGTGNGTWQKVEGACWRKPGFDQEDDHPVVCVSRNDAVAFCDWLGRTSGKTVGLPTEARWEYACRAGTDTKYFWGNRPEDGIGCCNAANWSAAKRLSDGMTFPWDDGYAFTSPSGKFKANAFGLFDMAGNAWQWCADWYDQDYLKEPEPHVDPTGPQSGTYRVTRGGSWQSGPDYCRAAVRRMDLPATRSNVLGFRVVVEAP